MDLPDKPLEKSHRCILITLFLLLTFPVGCSDNKMNQNNQNTSVTETYCHRSTVNSSTRHRYRHARRHRAALLDEDVDLQQQLSDGHFDAVRAKAGSLDAQFFSIWVEPQLFGGGGARAMKRADDQIAAVRALG